MRALLAVLLATTALPAFADTITAESRITAVTLYPQGAKITREVSFNAPSAGTHELLVTDLPASTQAGMMQLAGSEGMTFGAFSLRADRLPPRAEPLSAAQEAAKTRIEAAETGLRDAQAAAALIEGRIQAANARITFLTSFNGALPANATPEQIRSLAETIGTETLAATEAAAAARQDIWPAQKAVEEAARVLADAEAAFAALSARDADYTALVVALDAGAAGEGRMTVTHYINEAGWQPFYELHLTRGETAELGIERSVLVTQYSGEDWSGVDLTLSSSRPSEQSAPSMLWPELRWIEKDAPPAIDSNSARLKASAGAEMDMVMAEPAAAPITAAAGMEGETVVWSYPRKVDIASGVEDLRLALDRLETPAEVTAVAVPKRDSHAFVMAEFTNQSGEPLLPGNALLFREGVLVGSSWLDLIATGTEREIAFGPLETIRLKRDMPRRDSGQTGVFSTSNEQSESAVLVIENLGTESWPIRVLDQIPYSEQQDLVVKSTAKPAPTEADPDGQRGLLAWEFDLAAGAKQEIALNYTLSWPDKMVLR